MEQRNHDAVLVTLADRNFIDQAKQLFSSVYWNAGWKGDYMLLAHEIPEKDLKWFRDKGILVKKCKPLYKNKGGNYFQGYWREYSPTIFDVFYIFTPEFKRWKKVIFLEADILVQFSLDKLTKLGGFWATEVFDNAKLSYQFTDEEQDRLFDLGYNLGEPTFNPGTIVFSTDIINNSTFSQLKSLSEKFRKMSNGNEGILNLFFYKKWKKLPWYYNLSPEAFDFRFSIKNSSIKGAILHFVGEYGRQQTRPWNRRNSFYKEWKNNLDRADMINLSKIPNGKKSNSITFGYSLVHTLLKHKLIYAIRDRTINLFNFFSNTLDRLAGLTGKSIKKHNKTIYYKLKKLENK